MNTFYVKLKSKFLSFTHPFATEKSVRLACIKHTTSVNSEPGSNSCSKNFNYQNITKVILL